jgi:PAS domain S-box-containing protein
MSLEIDFADLFARLPSPYMMLDCDMRFIDANETYLGMVGRQRDELMGEFVFDAFPESPERRALFEDSFRTALAGTATAIVRQRFDIARPASEGGGMKTTTWTTHHMPVRDPASTIVGMLQKALDVSNEVEAEETRDAVLREFDHRMKNLLAKVMAICELTAREERELGMYVEKLRQRLGALGRTQSVLLEANQEASLADLLRAELSPFGVAGEAARISGLQVLLSGSAAQTLGMAFHELATNAAKYGALSREGAAISVVWDSLVDDGMLTLDWEESGFAAAQPASRGFGTTIIERLVPMETGGKVERWFDSDGHRVRFTLPLTSLART